MADKARVYISPIIQKNLFSVYGNKQEAVDRAIGGFLMMRKICLNDLKGIFSREELIGIVDAHNGAIIEFSLSIPPKFMLKSSMEDSISIENNAVRNGYVGEELLTKIERLTDLQAMFLLEECHRFWNENESYSYDLEKFLDVFNL